MVTNGRRVKKLIRESMAADRAVQGMDIAEPDWNSLLIDHLNLTRQKREQKRRWTKLSVMTVSILVLAFTFLILLTSVDEIVAGNFNFLDAIRNLGTDFQIDEIQESIDYSAPAERSVDTYYSYFEFLGSNPIIDYFKPEYVESGFELHSIVLTRELWGNSIYIMYENKEINSMYAIEGRFENPEVDQSHVWSFPNSSHEVIEVDDISVDVYRHSSKMYNAMFKIRDVQFLIEYHNVFEGFLENTVRNLKVYGR
ncbi:MAG TPA: hypothetical protein P5315_08445 [Clostridia bacterium]|nr:hypothetical protein [Clostridia bacterium]